MSLQVVRVCGRCGKNASAQEAPPGVVTEPAGWSEITLTGKPITNHRLCDVCTPKVRHYARTPGDAMVTL